MDTIPPSPPPSPTPPPLASQTQTTAAAIRDRLGKHVIVFKIILVAFFALLLLLPLALVRNTLSERQARYAEAVNSIAAPWGGSQRITGPVLVVPFTHTVETEEWVTTSTLTAGATRVREKKIQTVAREACFLPGQLDIQGTLEPSARKRTIYTAFVYSAALQISGKFDKPDLAFTGCKDITPLWDQARVCFLISDLRGVRESLTLAWNAAQVPMQPGDGLYSDSGLHARLPGQAAEAGGEFSLNLTLNGSGDFMVAPLARGTKMRLASVWPDPVFFGNYLPVRREVTPGGFDALWETSFYARKVPQQWSGGQATVPASELSAGAFGVRLQPAINTYRTVERAIKYGILFVALVFTMFFLFETLARVRLNALNYLLVGATLCVFFLGLLALSEFFAFGLAYAISSAAATLMIGLYCTHILRNRARALCVSAMLGVVYVYLYFVLRMEDFSLIAGTAALFAALGAVMYATRGIGEAAGH